MNEPGVIQGMLAAKTIAVVGLSGDPMRPSHYVSAYMQAVRKRILPVILLLGLAATGMAQQPIHQPDPEKQRVAMQRLSFLIGTWSGEAHVQRGPRDLVTLAQTEEAYYKLDGLILVIEGSGRIRTEEPPFLQALGIITFDDATGTYRIRTWNNGRSMESEVQLLGDGKSLRWGFGAGETRSTLLQIDKDGQWTEKGELKIGSQEPRKFMDLTVRRK